MAEFLWGYLIYSESFTKNMNIFLIKSDKSLHSTAVCGNWDRDCTACL